MKNSQPNDDYVFVRVAAKKYQAASEYAREEFAHSYITNYIRHVYNDGGQVYLVYDFYFSNGAAATAFALKFAS